MKSALRRKRPSGDPGSREAPSWNLQDAKARLSELVDKAMMGEPQIILRRGEPAAVILPFAEYKRAERPRETLFSFFQQSPLGEIDLDLEHSHETIDSLRNIDW